MNSIDSPLVISVGGSQQCRSWYATYLDTPETQVQLCGDVIADHFGGYHVNLAKPGASNRRHVRRAMLECINELRANPEQPKIVVFEVSFLLRKELWVDDYTDEDELDGSFMQVQLATDVNWWTKRHRSADAGLRQEVTLDPGTRKYLDQWLTAQRFFYGPYAESVNLYQDLVMFTGFMQQHQIRYVIFNGNPCEPLVRTAVVDLFGDVLLRDPGVIDLETSTFTQWCVSRGFDPIDNLDRPEIGHPCVEAHSAFAREVLIPNLCQ